LWGRIASCARFLTALYGFLKTDQRVTNPLQVTNLPHNLLIAGAHLALGHLTDSIDVAFKVFPRAEHAAMSAIDLIHVPLRRCS
jgi:hypothetical protein